MGGAAMRSIRLTSLMILWLLASGQWVHANGRLLKKVVRPVVSSPVAPQRANPQRKESEAYAVLSVEGWGESLQDAEQMALENARRKVLDFLAEQNYRLEWQPNLNYVSRNLIKKPPEPL